MHVFDTVVTNVTRAQVSFALSRVLWKEMR
jgi:hypothetical protein